MKKQTHKIRPTQLALMKETVRQLSSNDLSNAAGGNVTSTLQPSGIYLCGTVTG
jgi:hypothetical protein